MNQPRVLIVENDPMDVAVIKTLVSAHIEPNQVDYVHTVEEAIRLCHKNDYSLILADYFLDGRLTGADLFSFCENLPNETHFIFLTSLSSSAMSQIFPTVRNREFGHLQKPLRIPQAGNLIKNLLA